MMRSRLLPIVFIVGSLLLSACASAHWVEFNPAFANASNERGVLLYQRGEYDRAIQAFDEAIRHYPDFAYAFNNRGNTHQAKRQYAQAFEDFDRALQLKPDYAEAHYNRANTFRDTSAYDRAIQDYDQAIRLKPDYVFAYINRGAAYRRLGAYDRAIEDYNQAIRLKPDTFEAFYNRGIVRRHKGEYGLAVEDYSQAIRLKPDYAPAFQSRGAARFFLGNFADAVPDFVGAVRLSPTHTFRVIWLYIVRSRAGENGRQELIENATKLDRKTWPGPIVELYLERLGPGAVIAAASHPDETTQRGRQCEAFFFVGEYHLLAQRLGEARSLLERSMATCPRSYYTYDGAKSELERLH
jgi:lipoprotein NlpI